MSFEEYQKDLDEIVQELAAIFGDDTPLVWNKIVMPAVTITLSDVVKICDLPDVNSVPDVLAHPDFIEPGKALPQYLYTFARYRTHVLDEIQEDSDKFGKINETLNKAAVMFLSLLLYEYIISKQIPPIPSIGSASESDGNSNIDLVAAILNEKPI